MNGLVTEFERTVSLGGRGRRWSGSGDVWWIGEARRNAAGSDARRPGCRRLRALVSGGARMICARAYRHCMGGELDIDGVVEEMGTRCQLDLVDTGVGRWLEPGETGAGRRPEPGETGARRRPEPGETGERRRPEPGEMGAGRRPEPGEMGAGQRPKRGETGARAAAGAWSGGGGRSRWDGSGGCGG